MENPIIEVNNEVLDKCQINGGKLEITHLTGEARRLLPEKATKDILPLKLKGLEQTISRFINTCAHLYNPDQCHAEVSLTKGRIEMFLNEKQEGDSHIDSVISEYIINPFVISLGLNSGIGLRPAELFKKLRNYKRFAANRNDFDDLLIKLSTFTAKINAEVNQSDDRNGKMNKGIIKTVVHEVPKSFVLTMPIVGSDKVPFSVNIEFDSSSELFELWSDDFTSQYESEIERSISMEIKTIAAFCLVINV